MSISLSKLRRVLAFYPQSKSPQSKSPGQGEFSSWAAVPTRSLWNSHSPRKWNKRREPVRGFPLCFTLLALKWNPMWNVCTRHSAGPESSPHQVKTGSVYWKLRHWPPSGGRDGHVQMWPLKKSLLADISTPYDRFLYMQTPSPLRKKEHLNKSQQLV